MAKSSYKESLAQRKTRFGLCKLLGKATVLRVFNYLTFLEETATSHNLLRVENRRIGKLDKAVNIWGIQYAKKGGSSR